MKTIITHSPEETQNVARNLVSKLPERAVIALYGDLGAGKTTFTKGLAEALGVEGRVNSPTFLIHKSYQTKSDKFPTLHHLDLYRIEREEDALGVGVEELLREQQGLIVIEWPDRISGLISKSSIHIYIEQRNDTDREIKID